MISTFAFEIGGIFLLAALLMYGTMSGFIPRAFHAGKPAPIILAVALVVFLVWRFGPEISSLWRSNEAIAPRLSPSHPVPATPHAETPAPRPKPAKQTPTQTKAIDSPAPEQPAPTVYEPEQITAPQPAAEPAPAPEPEPDTSAYDSGIKRAVKRVGRFLHLERSK